MTKIKKLSIFSQKYFYKKNRKLLFFIIYRVAKKLGNLEKPGILNNFYMLSRKFLIWDKISGSCLNCTKILLHEGSLLLEQKILH